MLLSPLPHPSRPLCPPMDISPPRHIYGILGKPLGHSLSPLLHNRAFCRLAYPAAYFAWEKEVDELADFFSAVRSLPIAGLSVTLPHKEHIAGFLDGLSPRAASVGAVNTVFWHEGKLLGDNTDVAGFLSPLSAYDDLPKTALLLGAGGVCRAALAGLSELGIDNIAVAARNPEKARALEADFRCSVIAWQDRVRFAVSASPLIIINATPLGMRGACEAQSPMPGDAWHELGKPLASGRCYAYDLVYTPVDTLFLREARSAGCVTVNGLDFFMAQAMEQLRIWTGSPVPPSLAEEARMLVRSKLDECR